MGIKIVPQPHNGPDLVPSDFWLFPKLTDCRYETIEEMKEAVTKVSDTLTQEDFPGASQKLLERYNKCIAAGGDYFEGDFEVSCVYNQWKCPYEKSLETYLMILIYSLSRCCILYLYNCRCHTIVGCISLDILVFGI